MFYVYTTILLSMQHVRGLQALCCTINVTWLDLAVEDCRTNTLYLLILTYLRTRIFGLLQFRVRERMRQQETHFWSVTRGSPSAKKALSVDRSSGAAPPATRQSNEMHRLLLPVCQPVRQPQSLVLTCFSRRRREQAAAVRVLTRHRQSFRISTPSLNSAQRRSTPGSPSKHRGTDIGKQVNWKIHTVNHAIHITLCVIYLGERYC